MIRKVINLILSLACCLGFMFYIGPWIDNLESVKPLIDYIEEHDIDAGALYYTEVEEFSEANINMENTMDYTPGKNF